MVEGLFERQERLKNYQKPPLGNSMHGLRIQYIDIIARA